MNELVNFCEYWYKKLRNELSHMRRKRIFDELLSELIEKGFIPNNTAGLTSNISIRINDIIERKKTMRERN